MMTLIRRFWVVIVFVICLTIFLVTRYGSSNKQRVKSKGITEQSFQSEFGWGYDILVNDTILIHQDVIPGAPGNNGFKTEAQALSVGKLVIEKIKKKKGIPTINPLELDSLGIK